MREERVLKPLLAGALVCAVSVGAFALNACGGDESCTNCVGDEQDGASPDSRIATQAESGKPEDGATGNDAQADAGASAPGDAGLPRVVVNEIFLNKNANAGGDAVTWVELWGPAGTSLDDLKLRVIGADAGVRCEVDVAPRGTTLDAGPFARYWVVGGNQVTNPAPNVAYPAGSWGLDDVGSIQLVKMVNGTRVPIDTVGYGAAVAPAASPPTATSEGTPFIPNNSLNGTISRKRDDAGLPLDTGENSTDFCNGPGTRKDANGACLF